jgi:metal-sulfur cluster biosynthetic enzyme
MGADEEFNFPSTSSRGPAPRVFFDEPPYDNLSDSEEEIWLLIRTIHDPEYPYTLNQLRVVSPNWIRVFEAQKTIWIQFTPTIAHCALSSLIGLSIRLKILQDFIVDPAWKLHVTLTPGSHNIETEINKQINDKERVSAAMENPNLVAILYHCIRV